MSVLVESFRRPPSGVWIPTGGWAYQVKTPVDGPICYGDETLGNKFYVRRET
jgi:hypothetical protein